MESKQDKQYYLMVKNTLTGKMEKVYVTEAVYRAYKSFDRAEKKRKQRVWRCKIKRDDFTNQKSYLKRCNHNCAQCPYGIQEKDSDVSLEALQEQNADYADYTYDPATELEEQAERDQQSAELQAAIAQLNPRQQEIARLYFFENKTQKEIAVILGNSRAAVELALSRIIASLQRFMKKS